MKLYDHQARFDKKNPDRALLAWETGTGKTISACTWIKRRPDVKMLVVCPKGIIEKWKRELVTWGAKADVISRDAVKKTDLTKYGGIILDEAQDFSSPLFDKNRSKRASVIYNYLKTIKNPQVLLLTANPVRSTPWNIHTLACYLGLFWQIRDFRDEFFYMTDRYGRFHYEKKTGWQKMIRPYVESISDIVLMSDCADVPTQHHQVVTLPWTKKQEAELKEQSYAEPALEWHNRHRLEQGEYKWHELKRIIDGYNKVIVVCHYRLQMDDYVSRIGDDRLVYVLNGSVKDQDAVIEGAKSAPNCVFFIQASMGAGFDAGEFSVVVFASMSFRYVDYVQMKGRVKRINNLHENTFVHLLGGKNDRAVYNKIQENKDFDVHDYLQEQRTAGTTTQTKQARGRNYAKDPQMVPDELPF